jgi:hypothetical protein
MPPRQRKPAKSSATPADSVADGSTISRDDRPTDEEIRARAYELYLQRSGEDGDAAGDWLRAETEYRERRQERSSNDGREDSANNAG